MRTVLLMRHGKAEAAAPRGGDFERALTRRGREDSARAGAALRALGDVPDLIVASPARRAKETAEEIARALGHEGSIVWDRTLYAAGGDAWLAALRAAAPRVSTVLVVAHSPGVEEAAALLTGAPNGFLACPTAGVVGLACGTGPWKGLAPGCATLRYLVRPKMLRELRAPATRRS